jgi:type IV secretory pathway VirB2 component (pilin)
MEDHTQGISNSNEKWQPINQSQSSTAPTSGGNSNESGDRFGFSHLPRLFQYLEGHFAFSAALLSIIGYVVIAAFGQMQALGQYFGYIIFLAIVLFVYTPEKTEKRWKYLFIITAIILIGILCYTFWSDLVVLYRQMNIPFSLKINSK